MIEDYCRAGFGPAWREVKAYFDKLESLTSAAADAAAGGGYTNFGPFADAFYTEDKLRALQALLDEARRTARDDDKVQRRIAFPPGPPGLDEGLHARLEALRRKGRQGRGQARRARSLRLPARAPRG